MGAGMKFSLSFLTLGASPRKACHSLLGWSGVYLPLLEAMLLFMYV
jgi:hypothetical protein